MIRQPAFYMFFLYICLEFPTNSKDLSLKSSVLLVKTCKLNLCTNCAAMNTTRYIKELRIEINYLVNQEKSH